MAGIESGFLAQVAVAIIIAAGRQGSAHVGKWHNVDAESIAVFTPMSTLVHAEVQIVTGIGAGMHPYVTVRSERNILRDIGPRKV